MTIDDLIPKMIFWILSTVVIFFVALGGYSLVMSMRADGRVTYCYLSYVSPSQMPPMWELRGFREWREDSHIGVYPSNDQAVSAAKLISCPLMTDKK
jgi:hypothetical protein